MKTCILLLPALALCGCAGLQPSTDGSVGPSPFGITIPVPPSGERAGQLGYFRIGYEPNYLGTMNYILRRKTEPTTKGYSK